MKDTDDINELYKWVNQRYEQYSRDEISEEEYLSDLEFYKKRLSELEAPKEPESEVQEEPERESISPSKVRSTSIAGLRKKLMEEMRK